MDILTFINSWQTAVVTLASAIVGISVSFNYWTKAAKEKRTEEDSQEGKIKDLYKERLNLQDEKMNNLKTEIDSSKVEIKTLKEFQNKLESQNEDYKKIFQGRDEDAVRFKQEGRESMQIVRENARLSNKILEHMEKNDRKFNQMLNEVQKIYAVLAKRYKLNKEKDDLASEPMEEHSINLSIQNENNKSNS